MSNINKKITEKNISQLEPQFQKNNTKMANNASEKSKQINIKNNKYKLNYSNNYNTINNSNIICNNKVKKYKSNNNINIKCINPNNNKNKFKSPSKLNCETTYSINKLTNTYYVNGLNKNISDYSKKRSPDMRFIPFENKEIYEKKILLYNQENSKCICPKNYNRNEIKDNILINNNINKKENFKNYNKEKYMAINNGEHTEYFSDEELNNQANTSKKIVKYLSPEKNIKINNENEYNNHIIEKNTNKHNNHRFKSITNLSEEKIKNNKNRYSEINSKNSSSNKKYKYDIKIHNISNKKDKRRTFSSDNLNINDYNIKNKSFTQIENQFIKNKSFDGKKLKMQNSQDMQIIQEQNLYQIIIPIPPNKIQYACDFNILSNNNNYIEEENNEIYKINKTEIIRENNNINNKIKNKENINNNIYIKKPRINKFHIHSKSNNIIQKQYNINNNINNKKENILNIEKFEINILEKERKFRDEMQIENTDLNYERIQKSWNNIIEPKSNRSFSIEKEKKETILSKKNVETIYYKGNISVQSPQKNWNELNNKEKVNNINLIKYKKNMNLLEQNGAIFDIKGKEKNWNINNIKKDENHFQIKSSPNIKQIRNDDEEEKNNNINDEEISKILNRKIKYNIQKEIKNNSENSERSSEYDVLKKINSNSNKNNYNEIIKNSFKFNGNDRNIIINDTSNKYPKELHMYWKNYEDIIHNKINNNIKNNNNQLILELPSPEIVVNPNYLRETNNEKYKYYYRESLSNKKINKNDIDNNKINLMNYTDEETALDERASNSKIISEKMSNVEESQISEFYSPYRNMNCEYREEIISLNHNYNENNYNNNNENINDNESNEYEDDNTINNDQSQTSMTYMNEDGNNIQTKILSKTMKPKIEYIYKSNLKENLIDINNKNKTFIKQIIYNDNIEQKNKNNSKLSNENKNVSDYNVDYPEQEKSKLITLETNREKENSNKDNNENSSLDENISIIQNNVRNLSLYNSQMIKNSNNIKIINQGNNIKNNNLKENSMLFQGSKSLSITQGLIDDKTMKNDIKNKEQISIGNIVLNNTLKRKRKNNVKKRNKTDIFNDINIIYNANNKNSIKDKNNINQNISNLNGKIKILKK